MNECIVPSWDHAWMAACDPIAAGSVLVICAREGCREIGYLLEAD